MSEAQTTPETRADDRHPGAERRRFGWWHDSHPTFAALTGFFTGMVFVTGVPGAFVGVLRLLFDYDKAERLFPWVLVFLAVPLVLLARRKTRRFAQFMWIGMILTAIVVLGVASLALYFMVRMDR